MDANLLGENNAATLDFAVFTDRKEWRQSAHFGLFKAAVRVQEGSKDARVIPDIWKRFTFEEELDLRVNYGFTAKFKFENKLCPLQ